MKNQPVLLLLILSLIFCIGCEAKAPAETDWPTEYSMGLNDSILRDGGEVYYYGHSDYMYVINRDSSAGHFLCQKPNCQHVVTAYHTPDQEECDAYMGFGQMIPQFFFYHNRLYVFQTDAWKKATGQTATVLCEMDSTGQNRRTLFALTESKRVIQSIMHRGTIYAVTLKYDLLGQPLFELYQISMNRPFSRWSTQPELLFAFDHDAITVNGLTAKNTYLYYTIVKQDSDSGQIIVSLERLNMESGERIEIEPMEDGWYCLETLFMGDRLLTTQATYASLNDTTQLPKKRVVSSEPEGVNPRIIVEDRGFFAADERYLYCVWLNINPDGEGDPSAVILYDANGQEIDRIVLRQLPGIQSNQTVSLCNLFPTDGDAVFMVVRPTEAVEDYVYSFPKSKIGSKSIEPVLIMSCEILHSD